MELTATILYFKKNHYLVIQLENVIAEHKKTFPKRNISLTVWIVFFLEIEPEAERIQPILESGGIK